MVTTRFTSTTTAKTTSKTTITTKTTTTTEITTTTTTEITTTTTTLNGTINTTTEVEDCKEESHTSKQRLNETINCKAYVVSETSHDSGNYSAKHILIETLLKNTTTTVSTTKTPTTTTAVTKNTVAITDDATTSLTWHFPDEHTIAKNILLETLPTFGKQWSVAFQFKPTHYIENRTNILHMKRCGILNKYGYKTPWIGLQPSSHNLAVYSAVSGIKDF